MKKIKNYNWSLEVNNLTKQFYNNTVLDSVSFKINSGDFHALIGENGAGKSTLINLITGIYQPDKGNITIEGKVYENMTPGKSQSLGIEVVHQELSLNNNLTIMENIFLGQEIIKYNFIRDQKRMNEETKKILEFIELSHVDPRTEVKKLSLAEQQLLEFAKAIYKKPKLLILDEATSALNDNQVELMFKHLRKLKKDGLSVLFISHRLHELGELCDVMTVLKDGKQVTTEKILTFDQNYLVKLMTGRTIVDMFPTKKTEELKNSPEYLKLENVSTRYCKNLNFSVKKGEILGLGGLAGQGQENIMNILFGLQHIQKGNLYLDGKKINIHSPKSAMNEGFAYLPAERKQESLFVTQSINYNMSYARLDDISNLIGTVSKKKEKKDNIESAESLDLKFQSLDQMVWQLSGGNQQKVVLAKWLKRKPRLLLLNEPTRGIDVGTKKQIYELLRSLADEGITIILLSSDTIELIGICDRVIVMYENRINTEIHADDLSEENLVHASVFERKENI